MLSHLLLLLAQSVNAPPPSVDVPVGHSAAGDLVVIGRRAEDDLVACKARGCPPGEEIEASLQAAAQQFAQARYTDARETLQGAIRRNRQHASELPEAVASLYGTLATVAEHEGNTGLWFSAARNDVVVLRRHLGDGNAVTLRRELAFGDNMVGQGRDSLAEAIYGRVQRKASETGQVALAAEAAMRRAQLALASGRDQEATRRADEAVALAGVDNRQMVEAREIVRMRIARGRGQDGAVDALAARLRQSASEQPKLLFAPPVENISPTRFGMERDPAHDSAIRFADVGYWIRPDGRTAGVALLRSSGLGQWEPGILRQVNERRYVPLAVEAGHPGVYRVDRFTVRAQMGSPSGSRIAKRMGKLSVHVVDLTEPQTLGGTRNDMLARGD